MTRVYYSVLIPLFRSFILICENCPIFSFYAHVLIPLFRSFILMLMTLGTNMEQKKSVLIPLFRSFILI